MERTGQLNLAVDLGGGRDVDVEIGDSARLWSAVGPGFAVADFWLKAAGDLVDLRVSIKRRNQGIEIVVDRGEGHQGWWSADASPRIAIAINRASGTATAVASAGDGTQVQQVLLGQTAI